MDILSTLHAYVFRALHEDILKTSYMNIFISCAVNVFRMSMEILSWHHIKDLKDYMEHSHEFVKGFPLPSHYIARKNHITFHGDILRKFQGHVLRKSEGDIIRLLMGNTFSNNIQNYTGKSLGHYMWMSSERQRKPYFFRLCITQVMMKKSRN